MEGIWQSYFRKKEKEGIVKSKTEEWMKEEFHYEFKDGFYYYKNGSKDIIARTEEVGIVFDTDGELWLMLCHGRPEHVKDRMEGLKRAYKSSGNVDLIDSLVFCFGKFPVEELNCLIHYSGYGQTFYKRFVLRGS